MKFYAVYHIPTQSFFPFLRSGSTYFDFYAKSRRTIHKDPIPPRLFESSRMAQRYITEYCKGIRTQEHFSDGGAVTYTEPLGSPRLPSDFQVIEVLIQKI